jgi:hypothetical protein
MTNEVNLDSMTLEERTRLRKQMTDQAVKLAISSRWDEAANLNREFLKVFGDDRMHSTGSERRSRAQPGGGGPRCL